MYSMHWRHCPLSRAQTDLRRPSALQRWSCKSSSFIEQASSAYNVHVAIRIPSLNTESVSRKSGPRRQRPRRTHGMLSLHKRVRQKLIGSAKRLVLAKLLRLHRVVVSGSTCNLAVPLRNVLHQALRCWSVPMNRKRSGR